MNDEPHDEPRWPMCDICTERKPDVKVRVWANNTPLCEECWALVYDVLWV